MAAGEPGDRDIVFTGTFEEVNEYFLRNQWSDGLPVVPPTMEKIEEFLKFTDRSPDEVLGIMHPSLAAATVWNVAVNGVMAGCRPEYMPVLLAIAEVMADPEYGFKHGGSTPGWEALIIVNGPIRERARIRRWPGRPAAGQPGEYQHRALLSPVRAQCAAFPARLDGHGDVRPDVQSRPRGKRAGLRRNGLAAAARDARLQARR